MNFNYWRQHTKTEQGRDFALPASSFQGRPAYADGDMIDARTASCDGLRAWRKVLDAHPEYLTDQTTNEDLIDIIRRYRHVLARTTERCPNRSSSRRDRRPSEGVRRRPRQEEEKPKKEREAAVGRNAPGEEGGRRETQE